MTLGYVCKYTPVELLASRGIQMKRLSPTVKAFPAADIALHPNVCSYAKSVYESAAAEFDKDPTLQGIILTTCCDSIRRLYDVLRKDFPEKFFFLLDVPRYANDFAAELFSGEIEQLCAAVSEHFPGEVKDHAEKKEEDADVSIDSPALAGEHVKGPVPLRIGILGARANPAIYQILSEQGAEVLFDMTCTGAPRELNGIHDRTEYAFRLLNQFPCMRMTAAAGRQNLLLAYLDRIDGILYHTVKFCDNFSFEYAELRESLSLPVLSVETDMTTGSEGQIRTRIEAFLEEIAMAKGSILKKQADTNAPRFVLGIDSGSTSTNAVILNEKKEILAFEVLRTGAKSGESAQRILSSVLEKAGLRKEALSRIVSTGYGRITIPFADENVTEISCHGKGAHFLNPLVRTILDIGGQDSKAIRINEKGDVIDFVMNDKCAAGTGRFLEAMARTLEIGVDELGPLSLSSGEEVSISSMCTVFAESEVISLIAANKETCDIAMGVHRAIAGKAMGLLKKVGIEETMMMTGGVAKNPGVIRALEDELETSLYLPDEPEIVGALGAALYALE